MTTVDLAATPATDESACSAHPEGARRRTALLGIAVAAGAVCAGCSSSKSSGAGAAPSSAAGGGTSSSSGAAAGDTGSSSTTAPSTGSGSDSSSAAGGAAKPLAATSAVPVGGGTVLADQKIVLTQPTAGTFKAFTAVCTHQGCVVGSVKDGLIVCPCHGSSFHIADGSVANGPAAQPLAAVAVTVANGQIVQS
jgi:Rieske Fe-S protein